MQAAAKVHKAQFIVTTFHPEVVELADNTYGVEHRHRASTVRTLEPQAALNFVRHDKSHAKVAERAATAAAGNGAAHVPRTESGVGGNDSSRGGGGGASTSKGAAPKRPNKRQKENAGDAQQSSGA